jgi:hypothetical protein
MAEPTAARTARDAAQSSSSPARAAQCVRRRGLHSCRRPLAQRVARSRLGGPEQRCGDQTAHRQSRNCWDCSSATSASAAARSASSTYLSMSWDLSSAPPGPSGSRCSRSPAGLAVITIEFSPIRPLPRLARPPPSGRPPPARSTPAAGSPRPEGASRAGGRQGRG